MRTSHRFLLTVLAGTAFSVLADEIAPVPPKAEQANALLECRLPLAAARDNLEAKGYAIAKGETATEFSTQYKASDKDSERRLFGSVSIERARLYRVTATEGGLRFAPRHRETIFATGVLNDRKDRIREYDIPLTEAMLDTLKDMRREVCAAAPGQTPAVEAKPSPEIEQYILERCKSGDDKACKLLRLR
jgi:hypothetical protein